MEICPRIGVKNELLNTTLLSLIK